jgi:trehalose 6-phosphate phosphatase
MTGDAAVAAVVAALQAPPADHVLLLFDFDGTLCELAPTPEVSLLPAARRDLLAALATHDDTTVGIVSGRRLEDVRQRVGLPAGFAGPHVIYAGLHGSEIDAGDARWHHDGLDPALDAVRLLRVRAAAAVADLPGAWVEDKGYSFVLHTRLAAPADKRTARGRVVALVSAAAASGGARDGAGPGVPSLRIQQGHEMLEVLPDIAWNKGDAVHWIGRHVRDRVAGPVRIMYVGDDLTDEDAFAALPPDGVSVAVGRRPSCARFHLDGPPDVEALLARLAGARSPGPEVDAR